MSMQLFVMKYVTFVPGARCVQDAPAPRHHHSWDDAAPVEVQPVVAKLEEHVEIAKTYENKY